MPDLVDSLVVALQRERAKNVGLRKQLKVLQSQKRIVCCLAPPIGTEREIIYHGRKQARFLIGI